ncbi:MAG: DUF4426 domain-containing protein [Gammaproteobacteria bacterium]
MFSTRLYGIVILLLSCCITASVSAERSDSFGDYQIHYNALTTDLIEPSVARAYNIIRSKNRALVNIAVLRRVLGTPLQPVRATVKVVAVNLNSQLRTIEIRELNDAGAIYYIGEIPVGHKETLNFKLEVTPEDEEATHRATFKQEFYTE